MLSSYTQDAQNKWANYLPFVVFAYNTSVHTTTEFTPYRLLCGREAAVGSEAALRVRDARENGYPAYVRKMQQDFITSDELIGQRVRQAADSREALNDAFRSITSRVLATEILQEGSIESQARVSLSWSLHCHATIQRGVLPSTRQQHRTRLISTCITHEEGSST